MSERVYDVITYEDGSVYEGELLDDLCDGQGKMTFADGDSYEGEWVEDEMSGQGTYTYTDGRVYTGAFVHNMSHGYGRQTWPDGQCYVGNWVEDAYSGKGKMTWPDGRYYDGDWVNNTFCGHGEFGDEDGGCVVGGFSDGRFHGVCKHKNANGTYTVGLYQHGEHHAVFLYVNGTKEVGARMYRDGAEIDNSTKISQEPADKLVMMNEGEWEYIGHAAVYGRVRRPNGLGYMESSDGRIFSGQFDCGRFACGFDIHRFSGGEMSVDYGTFNEDTRLEGFGYVLYEDACYEGGFKNGHYEGLGKYYADDGKVYVANFHDNESHLQKVIYPDGTEVTGMMLAAEDFCYHAPT